VNQTNGLAAVALPFPMNRLTRWREFREFLGVSDSQMHNLSNAGQLPAFVRIGRGKFFDPNDIAHWLAARKSVA
jgi:predicted DNA-binding transcriptional regulator AlpA